MCFYKNKIMNHKKDDDVECIELLIEKTISNTNIDNKINEASEIDEYIPFFLDYINRLIPYDDEIIVDDMLIDRSDTKKIIQNIMNGKIIIRDKMFVKIWPMLQKIDKFEKGRIQFIEEIKKMDIKNVMDRIDTQYKMYYKSNQPMNIKLEMCNIPKFHIYNYLMTFKRHQCSIAIEDEKLYLYYDNKGKNSSYKISLLFGEDEFYGLWYKNYRYINNVKVTRYSAREYGVIKNSSFVQYFSTIMNIEDDYLKDIFRYHNINFYEELSKKYKNYKFETGYNALYDNKCGLELFIY
jgi:hypothetical protein